MTDFLKHIRKNIKAIKPYHPSEDSKQIKYLHQLQYLLKLADNENPLGPGEGVKRAVADYLPQISRYPEDAAPELKQALANYTKISDKQIMLGCGSTELLEMITRLFLHPGENIILGEKSFALYKILANITGSDIITIDNNDLKQDLKYALDAINLQTRLIILANPDTPTGIWHTFEQLKFFIDSVPKHVIVVIDEAYHEYMQQAEYKSVCELIQEHPNLIVLRTFSKAFALAGLRVGYSLSSPEVTALLQQVRTAFNVSSVGLVAALAALNDFQHLQQSINVAAKGLRQLNGYFKQKNLSIVAAIANFITVDFGKNATKIAQALLQSGIIVRTLENYGMPHCLRISIGTEQENNFLITQLDEIMKKFTDSI